KFMPRFDGPYTISVANPARSTYTLDMPDHPTMFKTFHASLLRKFREQDPEIAPDHILLRLGPMIMEDGSLEYVID
ncbi:hypothetical protein OF83DRAFT_1031695, partial [Amylostereum chailletii]